MRRAKHSYHYAVRSCKKKFESQKQKGIVRISGRKLKKNILLVKLYPTQLVKRTVLTIISKLFLEKYRSLYNSVPTDENELNSLRDVIDSNITEQIYITPDIIRICIGKLKAGKDDGNIVFLNLIILSMVHIVFMFYYHYCIS